MTATFRHDPDGDIAAKVRAIHEMGKRARGAPPLNPDPDFDAASHNAYAVTAAELRQYIEQFEQLEAEKKDIAAQQKEVMAEAKARGFDTKVIRKIIALRKRDPADVAEEEAALDMYKAALGMA